MKRLSEQCYHSKIRDRPTSREGNLGKQAAKLKSIFAPCIQAVRSDTRSNRKKRSRLSLTSNALSVYYYKYGLCDANYIGYMCRHLYQRVEEHKGPSSIGNYIKKQHRTVPNHIYRNFKTLRKCQSKFDCLIYEMLFIKELNPKFFYMIFFIVFIILKLTCQRVYFHILLLIFSCPNLYLYMYISVAFTTT